MVSSGQQWSAVASSGQQWTEIGLNQGKVVEIRWIHWVLEWSALVSSTQQWSAVVSSGQQSKRFIFLFMVADYLVQNQKNASLHIDGFSFGVSASCTRRSTMGTTSMGS